METSEAIRHAKDLIKLANEIDTSNSAACHGLFARTKDFLSKFGGPKNAFANQLNEVGGGTKHFARCIEEILIAFVAQLEAGLVAEISPARQAELDVVSDLLEQANNLLGAKNVHPAAPAVLIGATLEEFLRTWIESEGIAIGSRKPSIDTYTKLLRESDLISKQDVKDIT